MTVMVLASWLTAFAVPVALAMSESPPPGHTEEQPDRRKALLRIGPLLLTPRIRVESVGLDTNVFYTAEDRRIDFLASARPGLDLAVRLADAFWVTGQGGVSIAYFARTESQRHVGGFGESRVAYLGRRLSAAVGYGIDDQFGRLIPEIDTRVHQRTGKVDARLIARLGHRLGLELHGRTTEYSYGQVSFRGAESSRLNRDVHAVEARVAYDLTAKTAVFLESGYQVDSFVTESVRDLTSVATGAGVDVRSETLVALRVSGGFRRTRRKDTDGPAAVLPYLRGVLRWPLGPRTRLTLNASRDASPSAHGATDQSHVGLTTLENYNARVERDVIGALDLWILGGVARQRSRDPVRVARPEGIEDLRRNDQVWEAGLDLGYTVRKLRIGVAATYTTRRSTVRDLDVEGLLVGATVFLRP